MCINATITIKIGIEIHGKSERAISELLIQLTVSNPVGLGGPCNMKLTFRKSLLKLSYEFS